MDRRAFSETLFLTLSGLSLGHLVSLTAYSQSKKKPKPSTPSTQSKKVDPKQKSSKPKQEEAPPPIEWKIYTHEILAFQCELPSTVVAIPAGNGFIAYFNDHQIICSCSPYKMGHCVFTEPAIKGALYGVSRTGATVLDYKLLANNVLMVNSEVTIKDILHKSTMVNFLQMGRAYTASILAPGKLDDSIVSRVLNGFKVLNAHSCG